LENGVHQVSEMLSHARLADDAGLDVVSVTDHPYFADRLDAYAALGFVLGAISNITGAVIMTNLLSRPAPILARTVAGLSTISGGRVVLGIGAGGMEEEIVALGVPRLPPAARIRTLEEAVIIVRALSGGGDPVTFDGEFYQVTGLTPASAQTPPIWIGALGPKALAVAGRHADGWIPGHLADWRSRIVAESRPIVEEAAASAGRNPADVDSIYNVSGRITRDPLSEIRDDEGRWLGGRSDAVGRGTDFRRAGTRRGRVHLLGPSWRQHQRHDTEPLGKRSRARRERSHRQALTSPARRPFRARTQASFDK
jgi:alkanesulfonate monooxygenase SsuD/methylene tetrahydromethanopterin reductase-like flavin-dependent oxidoreductase (luciferase family)